MSLMKPQLFLWIRNSTVISPKGIHMAGFCSFSNSVCVAHFITGTLAICVAMRSATWQSTPVVRALSVKAVFLSQCWWPISWTSAISPAVSCGAEEGCIRPDWGCWGLRPLGSAVCRKSRRARPALSFVFCQSGPQYYTALLQSHAKHRSIIFCSGPFITAWALACV